MATGSGSTEVHDVDDTTILDSKDLCGVLDYLGSKQGKCYDIGSALGLSEDRLAKIRSECPSDNNTKALRTIIYDWLKKKYDTKQHGPPTWKALVEAVESSLGGDDPELAERIANDHPPQPSEDGKEHVATDGAEEKDSELAADDDDISCFLSGEMVDKMTIGTGKCKETEPERDTKKLKKFVEMKSIKELKVEEVPGIGQAIKKNLGLETAGQLYEKFRAFNEEGFKKFIKNHGGNAQHQEEAYRALHDWDVKYGSFGYTK